MLGFVHRLLRGKYLLLFLMLIIMAALFGYANECGLGSTYDSRLYLEIASQIRENGVNDAQGLQTKPPIFPILILIMGEDSMGYFNVICLLVSAFLMVRWSIIIKSTGLRLMYCGALALATPLYLVHSFLWTEPLFIVLIISSFLMISKVESGNEILYVIFSILILMVAVFLRFAALFILIPTLLYLLIRYWRIPRFRRIMFILGFLFALFCIFWVSNFEAGFERRFIQFVQPFTNGNFAFHQDNVFSYLQALSMWIVPFFVSFKIKIGIGIAIILCLLFIPIFTFRKRNGLQLYTAIAFIFLLYYLQLHFVFGVEYYSAERYLTPFYPMLLLITFRALDQLTSIQYRRVGLFVFLLAIYLVSYNSLRTVKNIIFWNEVRCSESTI